jgi:hypothetical protein
MNLPKTIKIGSRKYKVEMQERIVGDDGVRLAGEINHNQLTIKLDPDRADDAVREVLLHEVLHGVLDSNADDPEEVFVMRTATLLSTVMLDNPEMMALWR